ncbi:MAG TPA: alpha/beta hydrolase [Acidimicrobiales bacterium]|nr:alpha/beta hydrolase [Acidimicrobiales bacterium]
MIETVELRGCHGNRLVADVTGSTGASPVVLFHGGGQTRHSWHTTLQVLGEREWRAYAVDLRGHGESDWAADGDYSLEAFAGDAESVARSVGRPPVLVGASLGGAASLVAVAEAPDPPIASALVLVDIAHRIEPDGRDRITSFMSEHMESGFASLEEVADAIQRYNPHRPRPRDLAGLRKNLRQRADGRWVWHWDPQFLRGPRGGSDETRTSVVDPGRLVSAAKAISIPTLLVRGRQSDLLSPEGAREMLDLIPHAAFVDVAGAGHMVAGDRNDLFNTAIVDFLQTARASGSLG